MEYGLKTTLICSYWLIFKVTFWLKQMNSMVMKWKCERDLAFLSWQVTVAEIFEASSNDSIKVLLRQLLQKMLSARKKDWKNCLGQQCNRSSSSSDCNNTSLASWWLLLLIFSGVFNADCPSIRTLSLSVSLFLFLSISFSLAHTFLPCFPTNLYSRSISAFSHFFPVLITLSLFLFLCPSISTSLAVDPSPLFFSHSLSSFLFLSIAPLISESSLCPVAIKEISPFVVSPT